MKTLVSLLVGGVLLLGAATVGTQAATVQNRDRNNVQNNKGRDNDRNNKRRHHRRHHRHRRHRHHQTEKLSY